MGFDPFLRIRHDDAMDEPEARGMLLVVDDDPVFRAMLVHHLKTRGYEVAEAENTQGVFHALDQRGPDIMAVLLDWQLGDENGIEILEKLSLVFPFVPVVMVTSLESVEAAVTAVRKGAIDFLTKPLDLTRLDVALLSLERTRRMNLKLAQLQNRGRVRASFYSLVGESQTMQSLYRFIEIVADSPCSVMVYGESGSGKELVAQALHQASTRAAGPFVDINCAAIARELMESELFGHEKGAFTGADNPHPGVFERARGGTLFLDEIGEMELRMQAKLLRVLQERHFRRVGGEDNLPTDARIVAATNRELRQDVEAHRFREDLYYRLEVVSLFVPPLRERKEDIPLLVQHFLKELVLRENAVLPILTPAVKRTFLAYDWPGNVRELKNLVTRLSVLCAGKPTPVEALPPTMRSLDGPGSGTRESALAEEVFCFWNRVAEEEPGAVGHDQSGDAFSAGAAGMDEIFHGKVVPLSHLERLAIEHAMKVCEGNVSLAAQELQLSRATLYRRLKEYGIHVMVEEAG